MDPPGRHARRPQPGLEAAQHPTRPAHEDRQPACVTVDGGEHALGREEAAGARVDQVGVQRIVALGDAAS
jgi:hypothetical protein